MASAITSMAVETFDRVAAVLDLPFARAVVFGVHIDGHLVVDAILVSVIVFLLLQKSYKHPKKPLTEKEIDQLCEEWIPEPLHPPITEEMGYEPPILESAAGPHTVVNGKETVNFVSANYLGLIGNEKVVESCTAALEKYGVGSCGPRGFYGTIDTHLDCEARIANFLGTPDSILYSYGISAAFSAIPAFCKKGDIVIADEGVHWAMQNGLYLSRSTIKFFKHNDMKSLESLMEKITKENQRVKKLRRYIVVEAIYQVEKIDIITASMGHALATDGGFCTGSVRVVDHQRLSSAGYVFSASLPPYLASAAITAVKFLEENPILLSKLRDNICLLHKDLSDIRGLVITSHPLSPIVFLKLKNSTGSFKGDLQLLEDISERVLKEDCVLLAVSKRSSLDHCLLPAGIRLFVSSAHSETDLLKASESLKRVAKSVFSNDSDC